ncbi:Two-component system protein A [Cyphellophora attinorum]|uniref:Two-component system protein A n=1 Tax=Cyphellophora attinorum TaxID=1664694 RepID=A0A0N0NIS7_9EURO|nr:Two-component system protein A [Phialophora attinorum]KPI36171.1 Two-component system protein A [Phialophora attinorum]
MATLGVEHLNVDDEVPELDPSLYPQEEYSSLKRSLSRIKNAPDYFPNAPLPRSRTPSAETLRIELPRLPMAANIALASLQHLPTPLLVLSSLKTILLANEAMGRLLGLRLDDTAEGPEQSITDVLKGRTLSQIGIDMLSDGVPVWVSWEKFLDTLTAALDGSDTPSANGAEDMTLLAWMWLQLQRARALLVDDRRVDKSLSTAAFGCETWTALSRHDSGQVEHIHEVLAINTVAHTHIINFKQYSAYSVRCYLKQFINVHTRWRAFEMQSTEHYYRLPEEEGYDFMSRFSPWTADFSRPLAEEENPTVTLCRTQQPFTRWQIGLINEKTGKKSTYDVDGHPVFDEKGEFFAGLVVFKDVTEYTEKIATTVAENEQQFALICDMMPQMMWTTRPDGYHDYFSQRWYDYTGLTPQNSLGLGWKLPFHEEDVPETVKQWKHSLATGEPYNVEYRCQRHDGAWRWMLGRAMPLRDNDTGKIVKWFGTCTDIQDIVDARNASSQHRQQLLDVLHHSQMNMWMVDSSMRLTFLEGSPWKVLDPERARSEVIGKPIGEVMLKHTETDEPHLMHEMLSSIERILDGKSELELREIHDDNRWFRSKIVPMRGGKPGPDGKIEKTIVEGVIGITTEVTTLRRKEQENIKLLANESAAKEASKMKSSFLANMSHEIRTPIAGVLGMSELLLDTTLDQEQADFAQNIQRSANSLLTVINDILDFSKIESGRLDVEEVQFSLPIVLKDVAKMLSYAAQRKNLEFSSDLSLPSDLVLLGDPGRVRQILTNLLTNSIKFTSNGSVRIAAAVLSETSDSTTVKFTVADTGIGIEEDVKQRLFRPFSQADSSTARRFGGTGLGLTICKNLVELMKGTIDLSSKLGSGTIATFTIPFKKPEYVTGTAGAPPLVEISALPDRFHSEVSLASAENSSQGTTEARTPRRLSPPLQSPRSSISMRANRASFPPSRTANDTPAPEAYPRESIHILVVEDNPVNQQIAIRFIRSLKFSVSAVWNGREALEYMLRATSPDLTLEEAAATPVPAIVLMDVQMPVLDGYNATHLLRHHHPYASIEAIKRIPIIAMTASAIRGDRERCEKAGMDDYLAKPVKRAVLEKMILKWTGKDDFRRSSSHLDNGESKPMLTRTVTDHSSNCPEHDDIANEFLVARAAAVAAATAQKSIDEATLLTPSGAGSGGLRPRRASKSKSLIERELAGLDTENERTQRREEAEDKARVLRDAKLLDVVNGEPGYSSPRADRASPLAATTSNGYADRSGSDGSSNGVLALTEENVEKLNSATDGQPQQLGTPMIANVISAAPAEIPGPPPEMDEQPALVLEHDHHSGPFLTVGNNKVKRGDLGALKASDRSKSDWSTSTARPLGGPGTLTKRSSSSGG